MKETSPKRTNPATRDVIADLVARIGRAQVADEMLSAVRDIPAYARLSRDLAETEVLDACRHSVRLWTRWLSSGGRIPDGEDADVLRASVRSRALEGVPLEAVLEAYRVAGRIGWNVLRRHALPAEQGALLDGVELLMEFLDALTAVVAATYLAERDEAVPEDERRARELLERVVTGLAVGSADHGVAGRLGVGLPAPAVPFAVGLQDPSPQGHVRLAGALRTVHGLLAVTEGDRVFGLAERPLELGEIGAPPGALLALGTATEPRDLAEAREELELLVEHGRRSGLRGVVSVRDHVPELLLARSPRLAGTLRERYLAVLDRPQHAGLRHTLEVLLRCELDRGRTCALLHVHRNTLAYRLARVEHLLGIDLSCPRDLTAVVLALAAPSPAE